LSFDVNAAASTRGKGKQRNTAATEPTSAEERVSGIPAGRRSIPEKLVGLAFNATGPSAMSMSDSPGTSKTPMVKCAVGRRRSASMSSTL
jgi:hypothetical protein